MTKYLMTKESLTTKHVQLQCSREGDCDCHFIRPSGIGIFDIGISDFFRHFFSD
jgi:hypothetical protein